ncbi:MAG: hypothetical protein J6Q83_02590 [Clostridia bacterium]|nr:hypothetical protein [Clostridia bacterium]
MANDVVFKTKAFGGFNKDEVMDFVNKILAEKAELEKKLEESESALNEANVEIDSLKGIADDNDILQEHLDKANNKVSELNGELEAANELIVSLSQQVTNAQASEEAQAEIDSLKAEVTRLRAECEKKRDIERQVGAAMLDARVHSEELVEAAKERADMVTKSVYSAIGDTALKIDDLSTGIGEIARSFTKSVEEVELRIKALTGDMSKTAQLLISESGIITDSQSDNVKEVEYDFLTNKSDDDGILDV